MVNIRAKRAVVVGLLAMTAIHVLLFWSLRTEIREGYSDFTILYTAGRILHTGLKHKLYDYQTQWDIQRSFAPNVVIRHGPLPYNHAPYEAWLFVLFGGLPYLTAFVLWDVINLVMLAAVGWLMRSYVPGGLKFVLLLALAFFPVYLMFVQGQDSVLLLLLYALAFRSLRSGRDFLAGVFLGLGLFKLHLVLPVILIVIFRAQIRVLAGFVVSAIAMFFASVAAAGWQNMLTYPRYVWALNRQHAIGAINPVNMPNIRGLLDFLSGVRGAGVIIAAVSAVIVVVFAFITARVWSGIDRKAGAGTDLGFSLALVATVLVSYHLYAYDATLLLIPIVVMAGMCANRQLTAPTRRIAIWVIGLLLFTPLWAALLFRVHHLNLMALLVLLFAWVILKAAAEAGKGVEAHAVLPVAMKASVDRVTS